MKFLRSKNVDHRLAPYLNSLGYSDVTVIGDDYPPSLSDKQVLALAFKEQRFLLTQDHTDFGELIFCKQHPHCGVILFRLKPQAPDIQLKQERLHFVLMRYRKRLQHFLVVTPRRVKVREAIPQQAA
jgi:predicted nuclease of predicted toxin-antitoxin system